MDDTRANNDGCQCDTGCKARAVLLHVLSSMSVDLVGDGGRKQSRCSTMSIPTPNWTVAAPAAATQVIVLDIKEWDL